jgi:glycyl-tRNA synthetase
MQSNKPVNTMSKLVSLSKRRGFVFPSSEIYGGMNGFWDYGPNGTALKNNIRDAWWRSMVTCPPRGPDGKPLQIFGLDSSIILNPSVWKASGHTEGFHDEMVDCKQSKIRYRADHLLCAELFTVTDTGHAGVGWVSIVDGDDAISRLKKRSSELGRLLGVKISGVGTEETRSYAELPDVVRHLVIGPDATCPGTLTAPRAFNLMLSTSIGALQGAETTAYLRPETAQGIFINFKNVLDASNARIPFGIAQVGKAFRNEITPRNFIFRSREFEQMELEWFCEPETSQMWFEYWVNARREWWRSLGIGEGNIILRPHERDELAHYSVACTDVEYSYPFSQGGFGELEGIAHRGDFDLRQHQEHSATKLSYVDQVAGKTYLPHVIEPSCGLTRAVLAVLCDAYHFDDSRPSPETLRLSPQLASVKVGIFPLINKNGMPEMAEKIYLFLREKYVVQLDVKQSIGKRYAKMDEIGTPLCVTVDSESVSDGTVTVRHRDSCAQERVAADRLEEYLDDHLGLRKDGRLSDILGRGSNA